MYNADRVPRGETPNRNHNYYSDSPVQQSSNNRHDTDSGFKFLTHIFGACRGFVFLTIVKAKWVHTDFSTDKKSIDMLIEASTAEAEAVSAVWRAAKEASAASSEDSLSEGIGSESPLSDTSPMPEDFDDGGSLEPDVKLHSRAVCILMKILSTTLPIQMYSIIIANYPIRN